jgi:hypothetical protein
MGEDAQRRLELFKLAYETTGNGLFAWRAYLEANVFGVGPPDWVLEYLRRVAGELSYLAAPSSLAITGDPVGAVFDSLQIPLPRGPGDVLSQDGRNFILALEVDRRGGSIYDQEAVASEYGVSRSMVNRAWNQFRDRLRS